MFCFPVTIGGAEDHTSANLVLDAVQNATFTNLRLRRSDGHNLRLVSYVAMCRFIGVDMRKAGTKNLFAGTDANYPAADRFPSSGTNPEECTFINGVFEDTQDGQTRDSCVHLVNGDDFTFIGTKFVGAEDVTDALIRISAGSTKAKFISCFFNGQTAPVPLVDNGSSTTVFEDCTFFAAGAVGDETSDVINTTNDLTITRPRFVNNNYSNLLINAGGNFTRVRLEGYADPVWTTGSRPDMSDIEAYYSGRNTSLELRETWNPQSAQWELEDGTPSDLYLVSQSIAGSGGTYNAFTPESGKTYLVNAYRAGGTNIHASAIVYTASNAPVVATIDSTDMTITQSGGDIIITNNNATTYNFNVGVRRIG